MDPIKDKLESYLKTLRTFVYISNILKQYWKRFIVLSFVLAIYFSLHWFTIYFPGRTISTFHNSIDSRAYENAWDALSPKYQERWGSNFNKFMAGYRTTGTHSSIQIEPSVTSFNSYLVLPILFSNTIEYDVSFKVVDFFTKDDCEKSEQFYDCLWLRIHNNTLYLSLMNGSLQLAEDTDNPVLKITRTYKHSILLQRSSFFVWQIANIKTKEIGIIL